VAIVSLKNVQVSRLFYGDKGVELVERYTAQGKEVEKKYTAWFDQPQTVAVGSIVDVSGMLKVEVKEFQPSDKPEPVRYAQISLNSPRMTVTDEPTQRVGHAAVNEVWPEVAGPGKIEPLDGAPF
jgi:hypothetical protein